MNKIDCFIAYAGEYETKDIVQNLINEKHVHRVFVVSDIGVKIPGAINIIAQNRYSTDCISTISENAEAAFCLFALQNTKLEIGYLALDRLIQVAESTKASMVYADYLEFKKGAYIDHPVIDYQNGSLRDDFNFGPVQFYRSDVVKKFSENEFKHAGYYSLRLLASRMGEIIRIPENLFSMIETDNRKSGIKQFDYVRENAREKQMEMEAVCTAHLEKIGALLQAPFTEIDFSANEFPVECSVIIPVRNRVKTIKDAIDSVLNQRTNFEFNLIVVDNFSDDGTSEIIKEFTKSGKVIHVIPEKKNLGIGGCWNMGVFHEKCGKFAVQLDSDDLYSSENTLQKIVDLFYQEKCAMVIGSYRMTNFDLEEIPPGIIDHKEWTTENGANNALRINGLGAPRAFYTPILRKIKVPNVSYGEDYAVGLAISREYKIGRIYDPIYLCRRWEDNSDASLSIRKQNEHNTYKDRIRTIELYARQKMIGNRNV